MGNFKPIKGIDISNEKPKGELEQIVANVTKEFLF